MPALSKPKERTSLLAKRDSFLRQAQDGLLR